MGSFLETYIDPETSFTGVDGCALNNLKCEQRCDFSAQGYRCSCSRGYRLAENKQDCIGKKIPCRVLEDGQVLGYQADIVCQTLALGAIYRTHTVALPLLSIA